MRNRTVIGQYVDMPKQQTVCPVCGDRENRCGNTTLNGKITILAPIDLKLYPYQDGLTRKWVVQVCPLCAGSGKVPKELAAAYVLKTGSGTLEDALTCEQIADLRRLFVMPV